jgi:hypothetical protein
MTTSASNPGIRFVADATAGCRAATSAGRSADAVLQAHRDWLLGLGTTLDLTGAGTRWWIVHPGIAADVAFEGMTLDEVVPRLAHERSADLMWRANHPEAMIPLGRSLIMWHQHCRAPLAREAAVQTGV